MCSGHPQKLCGVTCQGVCNHWHPQLGWESNPAMKHWCRPSNLLGPAARRQRTPSFVSSSCICQSSGSSRCREGYAFPTNLTETTLAVRPLVWGDPSVSETIRRNTNTNRGLASDRMLLISNATCLEAKRSILRPLHCSWAHWIQGAIAVAVRMELLVARCSWIRGTFGLRGPMPRPGLWANGCHKMKVYPWNKPYTCIRTFFENHCLGSENFPTISWSLDREVNPGIEKAVEKNQEHTRGQASMKKMKEVKKLWGQHAKPKKII